MPGSRAAGLWLAVNSGRAGQWNEVAMNLAFFTGRYDMGNRYQAQASAARFNDRHAAALRQRANALARAAVAGGPGGP